MLGVAKYSETWNPSPQSVELAGHSGSDDKNGSGKRDGVGCGMIQTSLWEAAARPIGLVMRECDETPARGKELNA